MTGKENTTNFDRYLERRLRDPRFRRRFAAADRAWDLALQFVQLRTSRGLTQQQVADKLGTKQQAIARMENPLYTGHSLTMVKKYAEALGAIVDLTLIPAEDSAEYDQHRHPKPLLAIYESSQALDDDACRPDSPSAS